MLAVKARPLFLPPHASAEEAFQLTLQHCKWHILANVPAVTEARESEGIHQLRVALRRLRVALAGFGPAFRTPAIEALRMRAKLIAGELGPARDLDVFIDELLAPAKAESGFSEAFAALHERAEIRRREAWENATRAASGLAFHTFMQELGECIDLRPWRDNGPPGGSEAFQMPARDLAGRELSHHLRKARKKARRLDSLAESERHALRIALKKLRYAVEFFASLYPPAPVKRFARRLSQMQDILGLLQDVAVARATLRELIEDPPGNMFLPRGDVCFAAGTVHGWHLERASEAWTEAKARWKHFAKAEPFWESA